MRRTHQFPVDREGYLGAQLHSKPDWYWSSQQTVLIATSFTHPVKGAAEVRMRNRKRAVGADEAVSSGDERGETKKLHYTVFQ